MRIIFDQGTPIPLRDHLHPHSVVTAFELGWSTMKNGELLNSAEDFVRSINYNRPADAISARCFRPEASDSCSNDDQLAALA
jgi:hypothetical protein